MTIEIDEIPGAPDRRTIVLLHEGLGSVGLWREFPGQLAAATGRRVLTYSRHGNGRSARPPRPRDPSFFHLEALETLPQLLSEHGAERPILVGHSDGASIALIHAARQPTAALALLAPHVFVEDLTLKEIARTREQYMSGDLRERLARHHADPDAAFWGWCGVWLDPEFREWSIESEAAKVRCPTLLLQGVDDPYGSMAQLDRIAAQLPAGFERRHLPGGHSPHLEAGEQTLATLTAFCRTLE